MREKRHTWVVSALLALFCIAMFSPVGMCQKNAPVKSRSGDLQIKTLTSAELKEAISHAASSGDLTDSDAKELIQKVTDIETLMEQFTFIREHERSMIGVMRSSFH